LEIDPEGYQAGFWPCELDSIAGEISTTKIEERRNSISSCGDKSTSHLRVFALFECD
jgi:hypothetical protein